MPRIPITRTKLTAILVAIAALLSALGSLQPDAPAPAPAAAPAALQLLAPGAFPDTHMRDVGDTELAQPHGFIAHAAAATPPVQGCTTRLNTNNFSSRNGSLVRVLAPHYTVSPNVPGWADVNAIADFLNRPSTEASAHFIIDGEGNCLYTVPTSAKAWTEAAGNPFTVGIEFVAMGSEASLSPAQVAKGGLVIAQLAKTYSIPLQIADVTGCLPRRPGLADHMMFGACGGGHHDLRPLYGTSALSRQPGDDARVLEPLLKAALANGITAVDRVTCRKLNWWRAHGRAAGPATTNAVRRRKALESRGLRCLKTGPARVATA